MSLQSRLLAQPFGLGEPQTVQPVWAQPHRHQTKIRMGAAVLLMSAVCCQVFLAVRGSVEFLSSLPFPAGRWAGASGKVLPTLHTPEAQPVILPWANTMRSGRRDSALTCCHAQIHVSGLLPRLSKPKMVWDLHRGHVWIKWQVKEV